MEQKLELKTYDYNQMLINIDEDKKATLTQMTASLVPTNLTTVSEFGGQLASTMSGNSVKILESIKTNKTNEVVALTNELLSELNMLDIDDFENKPFKMFLSKVPIIRSFIKTVENALIKYESINTNVANISDRICSTKMIALRDNSSLQQLFDNNVDYIQRLREMILALKLKRQNATAELELIKKDIKFEAIEIQDQENFITAIDKRITDLQTTETILTQNLFQIRATQHNNLIVADKADYIVNNVMPIWRGQLTLAIINANQKTSIEAQKKIQDATNTMLRKNAELLKINSIDVASNAEQNVVSFETLQDTTQKLIETIQEVNKIHAQAKVERERYEEHLLELGTKLVDTVNNKQLEYK